MLSIIMYLITLRLDNLLLKTFGDAVKVPHFCCLMFLFFQMWFQLQTLYVGCLWSGNDTFPLILCNNKAQMTLCNLVCVGGTVDHCAVMSVSVHITFSSDFFCIACSNLGPKSGSTQHGNTYSLEIVSSSLA